MCSNTVVCLENIGKYYEIYQKPRHRLWQFFCGGRKKFYTEYWACADISFQINKGECCGIVGRNGAGKSTLLQLIAGTLTPSTGTLRINGRVAALLELGSGFNPDFTGRENVLLNAAIMGLSHREILARFDDIAAFADIGSFIDQPVKTYSSGMALRLAFAVMANVDADILIIDEALVVGDAFFTQKCMRFLRDFISTRSAILVSHDMNAICSLCSKALLMENGRIAFRGSPKEVSKKYLEDLYADQQGNDAMNLDYTDNTVSRPRIVESFRDMRQDLCIASNLRNDLKIIDVPSRDSGFGTGKATIDKVWFDDGKGNPYHWIIGGEMVKLRIACEIHASIAEPIVGFIILNHLGQQLFGDNTWLSHDPKTMPLEAGDHLEAAFSFQMPVLPAGEYHITAAIGEGTPEKHIQHHWQHEALTFTAEASRVASGLVGVPMSKIEMTKIGPRP